MAEAIILSSSLVATITSLLGGIAWLNARQSKKIEIMIDLRTAPISAELKDHIIRQTRKEMINDHKYLQRLKKRNREIPYHELYEAYINVLYAKEQGINGTTEPMQVDIIKWYEEEIRK